MKKIFLAILILMISTMVHADSWKIIKSEGNAPSPQTLAKMTKNLKAGETLDGDSLPPVYTEIEYTDAVDSDGNRVTIEKERKDLTLDDLNDQMARAQEVVGDIQQRIDAISNLKEPVKGTTTTIQHN